MKFTRSILSTAVALLALGSVGNVSAHGDVVPQAIDVTGLDVLGKDWKDTNPYRGNARAIEIGKSAYGQNCARCHGLEAVSGGIAPDLRNLPNDDEGDEFFKMRVQTGAIRNGVTYMPVFDGVLSQEGLWAIRSWLQSVSVATAEAAGKTATPAATEPAKAAEPAKTEATPAATEPAKAAEPAKTEATPAATEPAKAAEPAKTEATPAATEPAKAAEPAKTEATPAATEPAKAAEPAKTDAATPEVVKPVEPAK